MAEERARELDEATIGIVAEVLLGNWPLAETVVRKLREASLAAIGPVPQDRNAILDEVFAAISPTTVRNERIIRGLKSPEKPPAPTTPADDEPLCVICGEPWPCTCGSPHAKPTPPAAERAKPAASDDEMIGIVALVLKGNWPLAEAVVPKLRSTIDALIAEARREAAADMREWAAKAAEGAQLPSHFRWGRDAMEQFNFGKQRSAFFIRALPLTEEETIPKAEGTNGG